MAVLFGCREEKIILSQLNAIDNTERAAVRIAEQSTSSLIYDGDLVYHGKEALEVDLQNFPPPSLLLVSC